MSDSNLLPRVELEPVGDARYCVIWLHGLGADGHDFPPVVPLLGLGPDAPVRFVFPHAPSIPVTLNGGMVMPAWYDIRDMDLARRHDEHGILESSRALTALVRHENERGIPCERIVLAGFSQGGAIASHVALRHPERFLGLVMLSTYLVREQALEAERDEANAGLPIFHAHGNSDPMVVLERGEAARDQLVGLGYDVEWHEYGMVHQVCEEELDDLGAWFRTRFA